MPEIRLDLTDAQAETVRQQLTVAPEPEPTPEPVPEPVSEPVPEPVPEPEPPPPVVVDEPPAWSIPTPRAKIVRGAVNPPFEEDTLYEDCISFKPPSGAKRFTVLGGNLPTIVAGWQDFWIGGREGQLLNAGPRSDGKDLCQVKAYPYSTAGVPPTDGVFAFVRYHDIVRPPGSGAHADAMQMMAGVRLIWGGCVFEDTGEAVQPFFSAQVGGASAGSGPIEDCALFDSVFRRTVHIWSVILKSGLRWVVDGVDLGGVNATVSPAVAGTLKWGPRNRNGTYKVA